MLELDYDQIGMRIRQTRKLKGWSQAVLAEKCGVSMSFLGHIERGTRIMSLETFVSVCEALDIGADALLWGVAQPTEAELKGMWGQQKKEGADSSYAMYIKIMKSVAEIMNETSYGQDDDRAAERKSTKWKNAIPGNGQRR